MLLTGELRAVIAPDPADFLRRAPGHGRGIRSDLPKDATQETGHSEQDCPGPGPDGCRCHCPLWVRHWLDPVGDRTYRLSAVPSSIFEPLCGCNKKSFNRELGARGRD